MIEVRLRSKVGATEMEEKVGKILTPDDFNLLLTRDCRVLKPSGQTLAIYLRDVIPLSLRLASYPILHGLRDQKTSNRGLASGTVRVTRAGGKAKRTESKPIPSAIIGAFDPMGPKQYCRLTAWTGKENEKFRSLWPLFTFIGEQMRAHVPERWAAQMAAVEQTEPEWVIPGTPFSTITVNNTYPTGVHKDKGDLDEGFSTLACLRRGDYRGGNLTFPEWRVAVDMQDGDLLLMNAHDWHGNVGLELLSQDAERISVVCYYRTKMATCGTAETEAERHRIYAENRNAALVGDE